MLIAGGVTLHMCVFSAVMLPVTEPRATDECYTKTKVQKGHINFGIFRKVSFVCFCVSNVFFNTGYGIYSLHLPSYSRQAGFEDADIAIIWLTHGMGNMVGKIFFSFLGQHKRVNPTVVYAIAVTLGGVTIGITPGVLFREGILISGALCGFLTCVTGALIQSVIYDIVGYDRFADGNGISMPFKAIGNLIGGPLAGKVDLLHYSS